MDEQNKETGKTPEQIEAEQHAVERFVDGLVDAYEDALADVDFRLNTEYDRPKLIEAMKLAIQIDDLIEYLKQYMPDGKAPDEE